MGIFSGLFKSRDKPTNSYDSPSYTYFFGRANSGKRVTDRTALQHIAVYACVRVLSEAIAQLPLHVYQYTENGKERVPRHPLYFLLHDQPNPEMTSFVFRETLMSHLLIYGNAYAQIIRNGRGDVLGLYPLMPDKVRVDRDQRNRLVYIYSRYDEANPNLKQKMCCIFPDLGMTVWWDIHRLLLRRTQSAFLLPVKTMVLPFRQRCQSIRCVGTSGSHQKSRACAGCLAACLWWFQLASYRNFGRGHEIHAYFHPQQ